MKVPARIIIDDVPADGAWNMAVDHALLETANQTGLISIRFYRWSEPTLSLGYFQKIGEREQHTASSTCALVRRSTGGGAILHDQEITYSLCLPSVNRWSSNNDEIYFLVHRIIVGLLADRGIDAELFEPAVNQRCESDREATSKQIETSEPIEDRNQDKPSFLCFNRRATGDVILKGVKIGGSAQRRKRNALLQHGSLLLRSSSMAPELAGLEDLVQTSPLNRQELTNDWRTELEHRLGVEFAVGQLTVFENEVVKRINKDYYALASWNQCR